MTDVLTAAQRSYCMSRIRATNTQPEIRLRKALWSLGLRYRVRSRLPGRPDLVVRSLNTVLFIDGCFWHRCPKHATTPNANSEFWRRKLRTNVARDKRVEKELQAMGLRVIRIWEHEVVKDADRAAKRLMRRICAAKWA